MRGGVEELDEGDLAVNEPAGAKDTKHLRHRPVGIGDMLEQRQGDEAVVGSAGYGQVQSIGNEGAHDGLADVEEMGIFADGPGDVGGGEGPGAAADVEHGGRLTGGQGLKQEPGEATEIGVGDGVEGGAGEAVEPAGEGAKVH